MVLNITSLLQIALVLECQKREIGAREILGGYCISYGFLEFLVVWR